MQQTKMKTLLADLLAFASPLAFASLLAFTCLSLAAKAEPLDYFLVEGVSYDQSVLKPDVMFGHEIGAQPIRHDMMVAYMRAVASASDRMAVETIGHTHEGRPILFIVVTHPDNHARLEDIRTEHLLRVNPERADEASDALPVITWVNYGVHGAEASGMDAAVPALYHLAAAEGPAIEQTLKNSIILITAIFNPDGHARRGAWVTQYGSKVMARDPAHEIHNQVWPGGRTNHYWFDLNRQWLLQTQPESRAWLAMWHRWKPEVSADFHEMGSNSTYYFHPGEPRRKYPLIPAEGRELLHEIAGYHADWFDKDKKLYFTEEGFDNFYIGKGSTYPQVNGGLGILFEAGAQMGIERESATGVKSYADNIRKHFRTSLTTIKGAQEMRPRLHAYQRTFFRTALEEASDDKVKAYVFRAPEDPQRVAMFIDLLRRHDVAVYQLADRLKISGRQYGSEAFIVPFNQPQYRMAKAIFTRMTEFEENIFYDVSGWTLPLAYGLEHDAVTSNITAAIGAPATGDLPAVAEVEKAPYAYVMRWSDYYAPRALNRILQAGVRARVALRPITVLTTKGAVEFERGAIIVQLEDQEKSEDTIFALMQDVAGKDGISVHAAVSGRTLQAGGELGGRNSVRDLTAPRPLLVVGEGMSPYDAGEIWHQLDHRMHMGVTLVRKSRLGSINLDRYTHILMGGGNIAFSDQMAEHLKDWVRGGGTLVAHTAAARWASGLFADKAEGEETAGETTLGERLPYSDKAVKDAEHIIGGALFASSLDITHPMAFGYVRDAIATNKNSVFLLPVPNDPYAQVAVYGDEPLLSGYASPDRQQAIAGSPMMTAQRVGRGAMILFADNPNFRATYLGAEKLFLNSLFFSKAFDRSFASEAMEHEAVEQQE